MGERPDAIARGSHALIDAGADPGRGARPMRVLVTGNLGYIGPVLVRRLTRDGHDVIGLDVGWYDGETVDPVTIPAVQHRVDVRNLVFDAGRRRQLADVLDGVEAICHLAAVSNDPVADLHPSVTESINYEASARLCEAAAGAGVRRLILFSTCSVYGDADGEVDEGTPPRILTPYAATKVKLEQRLIALSSTNFWPVILRAATVYGYAPGLRLDLILNGMSAWAATTGVVRLMSTGEALRPQLHIEDLVEVTAVLLARDDAAFSAIAGWPINVGSNEDNHTLRELAELVTEHVPGAVVRTDADAWVDRRSYRVRFDALRELVQEHVIDRPVRERIAPLVKEYARIGLTAEDVRSLRYTRLEQLRRLRGRGILDADLRFTQSRRPPQAVVSSP